MHGTLDRITLDTISFAEILKRTDEEILSEEEDQYPTFLTSGNETVGLADTIFLQDLGDELV